MRISPQQYATAWYTALKQSPRSEWEAISNSVIRTVHRQGKLKWLSGIVHAVEQFENADNGTTSVTVRLAHAQDSAVVQNLVKEILNETNVRISTVVDPELIGGAQVETENTRWDLSLRAQLRNLEKTINA